MRTLLLKLIVCLSQNYSFSNSACNTFLTSSIVSFSRSVLLSSSSAVRFSTLRGGITTNSFQFIQDPCFDFIAEFFQVDIKFFGFSFCIPENIDRITGQFLRQFYIHASSADSQGNLVGLQINIGVNRFGVQLNAY